MTTPMPETALRLENVTAGYDRHPILHHLHGSVPRGRLLAIVGPNGGGKSTLLKTLTGELPLLQGTVHHGFAPRQIACLPQQKTLDTAFPVSVFETVALGLWHETGAFRGLSAAQRERVQAALRQTGIAALARRPVNELSGGQLQRARFARLILQDSPLLLLDEPFNAIDSNTTDDLFALIHHWHAAGKTILIVMHDFARVREHFRHVWLIARELLAEGAPEDVLAPENLQRAQQKLTDYDSAPQSAAICQRTA